MPSRRLREDGYESKTHPIVRLTDDGIDWGTWPGPGDEVGYGMHPYRTDDCLQAAIATATQVSIEQVPDLALDRRFCQGEDREEITRTSWERIDRWAGSRGLWLGFSETVPLALDRWIGVIEMGGGEPLRSVDAEQLNAAWREARKAAGVMPFQDHCVVMSHDRLHFDPSCSVRAPGRARGRLRFDASDISYGIAFIKEEDRW